MIRAFVSRLANYGRTASNDVSEGYVRIAEGCGMVMSTYDVERMSRVMVAVQWESQSRFFGVGTIAESTFCILECLLSNVLYTLLTIRCKSHVQS